jgi:hypothetical protein
VLGIRKSRISSSSIPKIRRRIKDRVGAGPWVCRWRFIAALADDHEKRPPEVTSGGLGGFYCIRESN